MADKFSRHMHYLSPESLVNSTSEVVHSPLLSGEIYHYMDNESSRGQAVYIQRGLFARNIDSSSEDPRLFYNVSEPSSTFICGSQGSGKSHTLSCILENCLVQHDLNDLTSPLTGIVFHYDTFVSDVGGSPCEAAWLSSNLGVQVRVLCSPTNIGQMKRIYSKIPNVKVEELRIDERDLNTQRMQDLMAFSSSQNAAPLYMHVITRVLRELRILQQRNGSSFDYKSFKDLLKASSLLDTQLGPLQQRLDTLESFMVPSQVSKDTTINPGSRKKGKNTSDSVKAQPSSGTRWDSAPGQLTLIDLSCPCVSPEMACSLFSICLGLFLEQPTTIGRIVALDEAHKYMTDTSGCQGFTAALLSAIRLQRHIATRVVISTQEPTVSPALLELCNITVVHRFTSPRWMETLQRHLAGASRSAKTGISREKSLQKSEDMVQYAMCESSPSTEAVLRDLFLQIVQLRTGEALLFAPNAAISLIQPTEGSEAAVDKSSLDLHSFTRLGDKVLKIRVRRRLTADGGGSIMA